MRAKHWTAAAAVALAGLVQRGARGDESINTASAGSTDSGDDLLDRVVVLTAARANASVWCMGLLIAQDAVLTYAHCLADATAPVAWAFFGDSYDEFHGSQETTATATVASRVKLTTISSTGEGAAAASNDTASLRRRVLSVSSGDAGAMDAWVPIIETAIHPNYTADGSRPAADLAVLKLQEPRVTTKPFSLAANMTEINAAMHFAMETYQVTTDFATMSRGFDKVLSVGSFRKVDWRFCVPPRTKTGPLSLLATPPTGQACVVAGKVEDRQPRLLENAFVLLGGKLVGLSVATATASSPGHRFIFLSEQADFITQATRAKNKWTSGVSLVVGGKETSLQGYLTGLRKSKAAENFCLGSLITSKFVLTAAHCVKGVDFSQASVGSMYAATEVDGEQIKVKAATVHPAYNATTFENDYAIVELEYISIQTPIALYNGSGQETAAGRTLMFYGYGSSSGSTVGTVQSIELPVVDKKQCKQVLQPPVLDESMMCAGGDEGRDACQGDSGGPLVYQATTPISLVAMASYGRGCGTKGMPAVYAVVATAADFIEKYVDGHRWVTSYGTATSTATTSPSLSPSPTPSATVINSTAQSAPTVTPAPVITPSSTPPIQQARSSSDVVETPAPAAGEDSSESKVLDSIATQEGWAPVSSILLADSFPSELVVDATYRQLTRDALSGVLLSTRSSLSNNGLQQLTKYTGARAITFYSTGDLSALASTIKTFDARTLRRRTQRFSQAEDPSVTSCIA